MPAPALTHACTRPSTASAPSPPWRGPAAATATSGKPAREDGLRLIGCPLLLYGTHLVLLAQKVRMRRTSPGRPTQLLPGGSTGNWETPGPGGDPSGNRPQTRREALQPLHVEGAIKSAQSYIVQQFPGEGGFTADGGCTSNPRGLYPAMCFCYLEFLKWMAEAPLPHTPSPEEGK